MCDPVTMGMMAAGAASTASSALGGKKGGGGGSIPTPSMPGLQMSPLSPGGGPSGTTPGGSAGGGGGGQPQSQQGIFGSGLGTSQMGGLLSKLFSAIKGGGAGADPNLWQTLPPGV